MVQKNVRLAGLLLKAALSGDTELWGVLVEELSGLDLVQEVGYADDPQQ